MTHGVTTTPAGTKSHFKSVGYLLLVAVTAIAIAGCGGNSDSNVVAEVGRHTITKAMLSHWIHITAIRSYQLSTSAPVPTGVVPDPPRYTNCVVYQRSADNQPFAAKEGHKGTLRQQCRQRYLALRTKALASLITCDWMIAEGEARGLVATSKAARQWVEMAWKHEYATRAAFERSLTLSGETMSDQLFRGRTKVISLQIEKQYGADSAIGVGVDNPRLIRFLITFPKRWAAKTSCRAGYVIPNCKQYKGPLAPEAQLP